MILIGYGLKKQGRVMPVSVLSSLSNQCNLYVQNYGIKVALIFKDSHTIQH